MRAVRYTLRLTLFRCALLCATLALGAVSAPAQERLVRDLEYGNALFHFYQEDYFEAAARLLAAQKQGRIVAHRDDAQLLLGGIYLSYGQQDEAGDIFDRLLDKGASPEVRDKAWLYAAQIAYQRGRPDRAQAALTRIVAEMPPEFEARRRLLGAQILIDAGDFKAAAAMLSSWRARGGWRAYAQYNLGVALIRHGDGDDGARLLRIAGDGPLVSEGVRSWLLPWRWFGAGRDDGQPYEEDNALRDKINLALGFAHLKDGEPALAEPILARIGNNGPSSSKARLGGGWAAVEQDRYQAALEQWRQLVDGDPLDPAVQESRLGVPFALARLGEEDAALSGYRDAIDVFGAEINRLSSMSEELARDAFLDTLLADDDGREVGWFWSLKSVPKTDRGRYLYRLMADHEFQEGLKNYRDLKALQANLQQWEQGVEAFDVMLATRESRFARQTETLAADASGARLAQLGERLERQTERVEAAAATGDSIAFANANEKQALARLERVDARLARAPQTEPFAAVRAKRDLLRGVLLWRLSADYHARLWEQRKALKTLRAQQRTASDRNFAIGVAQIEEPRSFAGFRARVDEAGPRIGALRARVDAALLAHDDYLKQLAIGQFNKHGERLRAYLTEAQFALASTYDRQSRLGDGQ